VAAVVDNAANTHIWSDLTDFVLKGSVHYFDPSEDVGFMTVGDDVSCRLGIGKVPILLKDNQDVSHKIILQDVLYFPSS
jgi:hypothetical protein